MMDFSQLSSFLEGSFGDQDDDEGLAALRVQLDAYPDLAEDFRHQLFELLACGNGEQCRLLLEQAHRFLTPDESLAWLEWLSGQIA